MSTAPTDALTMLPLTDVRPGMRVMVDAVWRRVVEIVPVPGNGARVRLEPSSDLRDVLLLEDTAGLLVHDDDLPQAAPPPARAVLPADRREATDAILTAIDAHLDDADPVAVALRYVIVGDDRTPYAPPGDTLTALEHAIVTLLSAATRAWVDSLSEAKREADTTRDGALVPPSIAGDTAEWLTHAHVLQNAVLSRAAGRAYPGLYRL